MTDNRGIEDCRVVENSICVGTGDQASDKRHKEVPERISRMVAEHWSINKPVLTQEVEGAGEGQPITFTKPTVSRGASYQKTLCFHRGGIPTPSGCQKILYYEVEEAPLVRPRGNGYREPQ